MRPEPLSKLLDSVYNQVVIPNEVLIVDGSRNELTQQMIQRRNDANLSYFLVDEHNRGLTKQRNFGISKVSNDCDIVCFLDDDTLLEKQYFQEICNAYKLFPEALSVGGYITNEVSWEKCPDPTTVKPDEFYYDGWKRKDGSRFLLRKKLGLDTDKPPCFFSNFSHGRSISFLPPSGNIYPVEHLMGGVSSFRKSVFTTLQFSTYFEGYGLYEDADFTLRVSKIGPLYINTNARLAHYHDEGGRPNKYLYGKMVVRNGWYVWRVKNSNPAFKDKVKWHTITLLLTGLRFINTLSSSSKYQSFTEACGRSVGWISLFFNQPK